MVLGIAVSLVSLSVSLIVFATANAIFSYADVYSLLVGVLHLYVSPAEVFRSVVQLVTVDMVCGQTILRCESVECFANKPMH